ETDEETEVAKKSEDMTLSIMKVEKFLSMVESEKEKAKLMVSGDLSIVESEKGKAKLMVSDEMVDNVLAKIKKLVKDFNRLLKAKKEKEAKEADEAELRVKKGMFFVELSQAFHLLSQVG
ncbi:hypothetical protein Tco_0123920, partial [Tanacetum coccineum]